MIQALHKSTKYFLILLLSQATFTMEQLLNPEEQSIQIYIESVPSLSNPANQPLSIEEFYHDMHQILKYIHIIHQATVSTTNHYPHPILNLLNIVDCYAQFNRYMLREISRLSIADHCTDQEKTILPKLHETNEIIFQSSIPALQELLNRPESLE